MQTLPATVSTISHRLEFRVTCMPEKIERSRNSHRVNASRYEIYDGSLLVSHVEALLSQDGLEDGFHGLVLSVVPFLAYSGFHDLRDDAGTNGARQPSRLKRGFLVFEKIRM